jgi:enamine deaminase RidA (YjgF/YER057c/UK114 family)
MNRRTINAPDAPASEQFGYAQAVAVEGAARLLYVSGQIPAAADGTVPEGFAAQCRQAWANVEAQLREAGMTLDNLVKATTFLSDRRHALENRTIRNAVLGARRPALTVIVCDIFDAAWLLEIEAVAAA